MAGAEVANGALAPSGRSHADAGFPARGFAVTFQPSPSASPAFAAASPARFALRVVFLAATGALVLAWLAAV
jgi:hypothetical protein